MGGCQNPVIPRVLRVLIFVTKPSSGIKTHKLVIKCDGCIISMTFDPLALIEQALSSLPSSDALDSVHVAARMLAQENSQLKTEINLIKSQMELRIENVKLQAEVERQKLENKNIRSNTDGKNFKKIVELGNLYKDHKYGPYMVKGLSDALKLTGDASMPPPDSAEDVPGLSDRVALAQSQGFRWDQRNREPTKLSTKLKKLSTWEETFIQVFEKTPLEELLDLDFPSSFPVGTAREAAQAATIARLQSELEEQIEFKPGVNHISKHKRLIEELQESDGIGDFVDEFFSHCPADQREALTGIISERGLTLRVIKRVMCKELLPRAGGSLVWSEHDHMDDQKLSSMYHGEYDDQIRNLIKKFLGEDAETG